MNNNINELNMDMDTYNKVKGKLNPDERKSVTITSDKPSTNSTSINSTSMINQMEENEVIAPKDSSTIKYLSNVIDKNTGEISKPFSISNKKYQVVRGHKQGEVVIGVYCFDEVGEDGENLIHSLQYFEENIAKPMKEMVSAQNKKNETDFMDYLNLVDLGNSKLFFIDNKSGNVIASFKNLIDMATSGKKLGDNQRLVNRKQLKAIRFGTKLKENIGISEETVNSVNVEKLNTDVNILIDKMTKMFGNYFAKLNTDIEKATFLANVAKIVGVPKEKISSLLNTYDGLTTKNDMTVRNN